MNRGNVIKGVAAFTGVAGLTAGTVFGLGGGEKTVFTNAEQVGTPQDVGVVYPDVTTPTLNTVANIADALTVKDETSFDCIKDADGSTEILTLSDGTKIVAPRIVTSLPVDSTLRTEDNKLWSGAVANPISEESLKTKEGALRAFQNTVCESPEIASMVGNWFANLTAFGTKVVDLNPWLKPSEGDPSIINDRANEFIPQFKDPEGTTDLETVQANQAQRKFAEQLNTLLNRFENLGIKGDIKTSFNYNLAAGNLRAGDLPEFEANPEQYVGRFIILRLTTKDGRCITLLINVDDQRIAEPDGLDCAIKPPKPPKITPSTTSTTLTTTVPPTTSTTLTTTVPPTTSTTLTTTVPPTTSTTSTTTVPPTTTTAEPSKAHPATTTPAFQPGDNGGNTTTTVELGLPPLAPTDTLQSGTIVEIAPPPLGGVPPVNEIQAPDQPMTNNTVPPEVAPAPPATTPPPANANSGFVAGY